jgi:hypothetical protein
MVEVIIGGQVEDPGIIGEAHRSCKDLGKILAPHDLDLGICGIKEKRKMLEERVSIGQAPQKLILDLIPSCKRQLSPLPSTYRGVESEPKFSFVIDRFVIGDIEICGDRVAPSPVQHKAGIPEIARIIVSGKTGVCVFPENDRSGIQDIYLSVRSCVVFKNRTLLIIQLCQTVHSIRRSEKITPTSDDPLRLGEPDLIQ